MSSDDMRVALAREMLRVLPESFIAVFQDDPEFYDGFDRFFSRKVTFGSELSFDRSKFFDELPRLYLTGEDREITSDQGSTAILSLSDSGVRRSPVLLIGDRSVRLPDTWYVSPIENDRLEGIRKFIPAVDPKDSELYQWLATLDIGHLDARRAVAFEAELALVPNVVANQIYSDIGSKKISVDLLAPRAARYFERLVGRLSAENTIGSYIREGANAFVRQLVESDPVAGAKSALLLSAHPHFYEAFGGLSFSKHDLQTIFEWVATSGDLISQLGAFEWGMTLLGQHPEIEDKLFSIASTIAEESPNDTRGRFKELSNLFCFVEGSIAHTGVLRSKPAFWRRLATIAQDRVHGSGVANG